MFLTLYGEKSSFRLSVRIIPAHRKYRREKAGTCPWRVDLRREKDILSRPIIGHTPRKLPARPQSPASSQCSNWIPEHGNPTQALLFYLSLAEMSRVFSQAGKKKYAGPSRFSWGVLHASAVPMPACAVHTFMTRRLWRHPDRRDSTPGPYSSSGKRPRPAGPEDCNVPSDRPPARL